MVINVEYHKFRSCLGQTFDTNLSGIKGKILSRPSVSHKLIITFSAVRYVQCDYQSALAYNNVKVGVVSSL